MLGRRLIAAAQGGAGVTVAPGYVANAVLFGGTNEYLTRGGNLTGNADGKKGIFSCWIKLNGGDGLNQIIFEGKSPDLKPGIFRSAADTFKIIGANSAGSNRLIIETTNTYVAGSVHRHFLASWDMAVAGSGRIRINDVSDYNESTFINDTLDYDMASPDFSIGARLDASLKLDGCLADLYWNNAEYLDFDVEANVRKFIDAAGKPVDLGPTGSLPTGTDPIVFQTGPTSTWHINAGPGGGFTEFGTLGDCSDGPSD